MNTNTNEQSTLTFPSKHSCKMSKNGKK